MNDNNHKDLQTQEDETTEQPKERPQNAVTKLYDKLPFTYRQVDIFVKVMIVVLALLLIYGIVKGNMG